jgi:hypothetical protein
MKKIYTILMTVLFSTVIFAQPQKMSYQAVIRNSSNALVTSTAVGMRISILQATATGTAVYVETQTPTTNANGLVSIEIGGGTVVAGTFANIDWSTGTYFIKTETDPTGGTSYTITGTSQLLSVPYALFAKTVSGTSGTNTGDNAINTTYSGLVTNATHTGDAIGSGALTLANVNSNIGMFNNITINAKGLATAGSNVSYLTSETDPTVKAINGIVKSNGTTISAATAGTDYLTPTGSAASLTGFPTLNQNTTGSAASFTGSLAGDVTGSQNATIVGNSAVLGKVLTGYASGAGTVAATDNILQAIQKINGNNPMHYIGESYGGGIVFYVYDNGQHGLIAATEDQSTGLVWTTAAFQSIVSNAVRDGVNGGITNTERIIIQAGVGSYAAQLCANYQGGNYADWYLPSEYELNLLYLQKAMVGGFADSYYWSSTEFSNSNAWGQDFTTGSQGADSERNANYVRAIRAF